MNLHTLSNTLGAKHGRIRVGRGRGSGKGKTCGRGQKGQMSRKGHKHKWGFEGGQMKLIRRIPKRGFKHSFGKAYAPVNVGDLCSFDDGTEVTLSVLKAAGIVKGHAGGVKVLGGGDLNKKLSVKVQAFSASARKKIEAAGGTCKVVTD